MSDGAHVALIPVSYDRLQSALGLPKGARILEVRGESRLTQYEPQTTFVLIEHPALGFVPSGGVAPILRHLFQGVPDARN